MPFNLIRIFIFSLGILVLQLLSCSIHKSVEAYSADDFVVFENAPSATKADSEITPDQLFRVELVKGWNKSVRTISGNFIEKFDYLKGQEIIFIYDPWGFKIPRENREEFDLRYSRFKEILSKDLTGFDLETMPLKHHRRFGIKVLDGGHFVAMYLNIPEKSVAKYNYALSSLVLKKR